MLSDFERADRIGEFWSYPESRAFAELLIDCEEDRTLRAVLVGMLLERERGRWGAGTTQPFWSLYRASPPWVCVGVLGWDEEEV
jgi:hypothetical protein